MISDDVWYLYHLEALRAELQGMIWENEKRKSNNESLAYTDDDFINMAERIRGYLK